MSYFYLTKNLRDVYPHATRFQVAKYNAVRFIGKVSIAIILALVVAGAFISGRIADSNTIDVVNPTITKTIVTTTIVTIPPVLERIAKAESSDEQFAKDGQVTIHVNKNGTYDIGQYQINSIWNATATKMGYNLTLQKDNEAFALWLFDNYGSTPWNSSQANWNK